VVTASGYGRNVYTVPDPIRFQGETVTVDVNLHVVDDFLKALDERDWDRYFDLLSEDVEYYHPSMERASKGLAAHRRKLEFHTTEFSDYRIDVVRRFGEGDWVCAEWTSTTSEIVHGRRRRVRFEFCGVFRIKRGKIARIWEYVDRAGHPA